MAADDQTIVLGAKDQASKIIEGVGDQTQKLGHRVKKMSSQSVAATKRVEVGFNALKATTGPLIAAFAAFKAATAGLRMIGESAEAFDTQQEAVRGLTKAMELSGDTAGPTIEQHKAFASAMQESANVGDEVTLGLMKQASMLGVSNDELQGVTKAAIGMAEATGASLDDSLRKVNESLNGNTEAFAEFLPQLRTAASDEERLAIVTKTANDGLQQKADRAKTAAGAGERLSNSWGDFLEVMGAALAPVRQFISAGLSVLVETIQTAVVPALNSVMPSAETIKSAMERMKNGLVEAITVAEVVVTNFSTVWELVSTSAQLHATRIMENIKHVFTGVIPQILGWFGDNFTTILSDVFEAAVVITQNRIKQIGDIITRLWEFVKSGFEGGAEKLFSDVGDIAARNLLEGFTAKTKALPEIAGRAITDGERAMMQKISGATGNLSDQIAQKMQERLADTGKKSGDAMVDALKSTTEAAAGDVVDKATKNASAEMEKISGKATELKATQSRLLTRGPSQDPQEKVASNTERTAKGVDKVAANLKDLASKLTEQKGGELNLEVIS